MGERVLEVGVIGVGGIVGELKEVGMISVIWNWEWREVSLGKMLESG